MNPIIVGTGWCAYRDGRNTARRTSKRMYEADYLAKIWLPYIEWFIKPKGYFIYSSNCEIRSAWDTYYDEGQDCYIMNREVNRVTNLDRVEEQSHSHDAYCAMIMGAQFALLNGCDFVYIEQDCLVYRLDKALEWADGKKLVYGFGKWSHSEGWSEDSLQYIANVFLPEYIYRLNTVRFQEIPNFIGEPHYHKLFKDVADFWPFGFGRKRPIDFEQEIFYAQQLSDEELDGFLNK